MTRRWAGQRHDLHLHSTRSDGLHSPDDVLAVCARGGLDVIALTDHDLAGGLRPGVHAIDGRSVRVLAGAEISGVHAGREHHLLVYFPDEAPASFQAFCAERCRRRAERYEVGRQRLAFDGVPAADDTARRGERALTRLHLARALVREGHARDLAHAFRAHLGDDGGAVPHVDLPFIEAIRIARDAGGITSWAHPPMPALRAHLPAFVDAGLQGIEALRPGTPRRDLREARTLAARYGLFLTGGSDWHGAPDPAPGLFHVDGADLDGFHAALARAA